MSTSKTLCAEKPPPRGINLFALVLDELVSKIGDEFSTEELMNAAQYLIALSKNDYVTKLHPEGATRPNYYSHDVADALRSRQMQILCFEQLPIDVVDYDELQLEAMERLRRIQLCCDESRWEF